MENLTFEEIHQQFLLQQQKQKQQQQLFISCCSLFLNFECAKTEKNRLVILYILYSQYANLPLEQNPFLDFFLNLLDNCTVIERHFVDCILEGTLSGIANLTPQEVCTNPSILPTTTKEKDNKHIATLKLKVAKLIDDPNIVILNDQIIQLLSVAGKRPLTLSENEILRKEKLSDYPLSTYVLPNELPALINLNQFLAFDILSLLLESDKTQEYLQAILDHPITLQSIESIHHILVHKKTSLSQDFIHYYISNSIRSCDQLEDGLIKDKQVKQVAKFIQSLLEQDIISMAEYFVEIQAFCVSYMKIKGVVQLFRLASSEARQINE
ncbi:hypothetical protein G6F61_010664 [Rhizopus arrhizus]|uniref:CCR4-NOT transcription complex subunit 11 n=1 Tax=Rhizopus oryzae TaxID=64495 RepID=A0A9P6WZT0_RHIOR|nr:hypothetical protein G6F64_011123 [Rhizopus arrhizus]KAG1372877.1 hypothetical protein G6F61_010664 [Rhizopus arrhizus]